MSGTASGETLFGPESRSTSWLCSSVPMPPMPVPMMQAIRVESYGSSSDQTASASASSEATIANCVKRSARRASLTDRCSLGSNSVQAPTPSWMPEAPARQRSYSVRAPTPSGVTAPTPVTTTSRMPLRPRDDEVDRVADRLDLGDVVALELDAVLVLDDLRELGEVERVDVELLERGLARDRGLVHAELGQRVEDGLLDGLGGDGGGHGGFSFAQADMPPSTNNVVPVT